MSALRPEDLALVRALADLYLDRGDPKRALAKLQICFKADPADTETLNLLADAFIDLGEREKAVAVLKELAQIYDSLGYEEYRNQVYDRIAEVDPAQGAGFEADSSLEMPGGEEVVAGLDLTEQENLAEDAARSLAEAEVYLQYGLTDKARGQLERATAQFPAAYSCHRMLVRLYASVGDVAAAQDRLNSMYEIAMDLGDYGASRACLTRAAALAPDDEAAQARLDAFVEAMGEFAPPPREGGEDLGDVMASAIELGSSIAGSVADQPGPTGDLERDFSDEFDFDDDEMQRLAAELAREISDGGEPSFGAVDNSMVVPQLDSPAIEEPVHDPFGDEIDIEDDIDIDHDQSVVPERGGDDDLLGDLLGDLDDDDHDFDGGSRSAFEIGKSYYDTGLYSEALIEFQASFDAHERLDESLEYLGRARRRTHDFRGAVDAFKQLLTRSVADAGEVLRVMFELGVTYEAAGNRRGAYKIYKKITDRDGTFRDGEVLNRVESLAVELGIN